MSRLVGKFYDLVFNRWAVSRADAFNLSRVKRRLGNVGTDRVVYLFSRVADVAIDLFLLETIRRKRKRHRKLIARLRFERVPIDGSAVESWRCSCLQATDGKTEAL